jgi:hypothetical protein
VSTLIGLPVVTSTVPSNSAVDLEVSLGIEYAKDEVRNRVDHQFVLDGGCQYPAVIPESLFAELIEGSTLSLDQLEPLNVGVAGGGSARLRIWRTTNVKAYFLTGRNAIRETNLLEICVGGNDFLLGLPGMTRLGVGQPRYQQGVIAVYPVKNLRI